MEHEPMRTESTGDITLVQPIADQETGINSSNPHEQLGYMNNNSDRSHVHPLLPDQLVWYQYHYAAALNHQVLNTPAAALWGSMGNATSASGASSSNMNLTIDGNVYDFAQAKMLFVKMKEDLSSTQVSINYLHQWLVCCSPIGCNFKCSIITQSGS